MTFVSNETQEIVASLSQSAIRYVQPGDKAEVVFTVRPGRVYTGRVTHVLKATGTAQMTPSGELPTIKGEPSNGRYPLRVTLDDDDSAEIPQGAGGTVHVITKVVMRMQAWLAYLTSP